MSKFEVLDPLIEKFNKDIFESNLDSIDAYINEEYFIQTVSNNSESSIYKFILVSRMNVDDELRYKLFKKMYNSVVEDKKWRICQSLSCDNFYDYCRDQKLRIDSLIKKDNKEKDNTEKDNINWLMNTCLVEMLTSDNPNLLNIKYLNNDLPANDANHFYDLTTSILLSKVSSIPLQNIIDIFVNNYKFVYFFLGDDEYNRFFKSVFDSYSNEERIKIAKSTINKILNSCYEKYYAIACLVFRLTNVEDYENKIESLPTVDEFWNILHCENVDRFPTYIPNVAEIYSCYYYRNANTFLLSTIKNHFDNPEVDLKSEKNP